MSTISLFKSIENKPDVYRGKDCAKKFCESLREHAMKIIHLKNMKLLTKEQQESYENAEICYVKKNLEINIWKIKNIFKLEINVQGTEHHAEKYRVAAHSICNLKYSVPKKIPIAFHNGSNRIIILSWKS